MIPHLFPLLLLSLSSAEEDQFMIRLFNQYHGLMFVTAMQYLHSPQLADDAVSQCFLKLIVQIHTLMALAEPQLKAYIYRSAKNCAIDLARSEALRSAAMECDVDDIADDALPHTMDMDERASLIADALEQLSPIDQEMIRLFYYEGYTQREIATRFHIQPSSVASRLNRARNCLRKTLMDMGMSELF